MVSPSNPCVAPSARDIDESDAALVAAARDGAHARERGGERAGEHAGEPDRRTEACFQIWSKYAPFVVRLVRGYCGPRADLDDLAQEVFLRVFSRIDEVRDPNALRGFIAGICLGVVRNMSRRARVRGAPSPLSADDDERIQVPAPGTEDEARQALRHLWRLLDAASAEDRSLFVARYVERLEMSEVAQAHRVSIGTAKRRVTRMTERMEAAMLKDAVLAEYVGKLVGKSGHLR
jgi:RNA polymerase sigma-70 factor (ECF subfamily)